MGLTITNGAAVPLRFLEWGAEYLHYNPAAPWSLIIDSDSLVTSGFAGTQVTLAGSYDPNATGSSAIQSTVLGAVQAICGTGVQPHVGTFRVKARVNSGPNGCDAYFRLAWRAGDDSYTTNDPARLITTTQAFYAVDLGLLTIPPASQGTQSWDGRIEAWSLSVGDTLYVDFLMLIPVEAGYGKATATFSYSPGVITARDDFTGTTAAAVLNGRVAPAGGTWVTSGVATDFVFADPAGSITSETIVRSTGSEASRRYAILGTATTTDTEVSVRFRTTLVEAEHSAIARWTDSSNHLYAAYSSVGVDGFRFEVGTVIAGARAVLETSSGEVPAFTWCELRLLAFSSGRAIATLVSVADGTTLHTVDVTSTTLATGGTLATGKRGLADYGPALATSRYYDDFYVATPAAEPVVMYASRQLDIRSDSTIRESSAGGTWGRPPSYRGARFKVGPAGSEDRTTRVVVLGHRNNLDAGGEWTPLDDSLTLAATLTPRYSVVPGA
jgi:hypothetical protein